MRRINREQVTGLFGKPLIWCIYLLLLAAAAGCSGQAVNQRVSADTAYILQAYPELAGREAETAEVLRVIDGDTFAAADGRRIRLVGVNTPETHGTVEYYGKEASAYAKKMLEGRKVVMFKDVSETDRYGRLLRLVFIEGDTEMFNERLIRQGYANTMTISPDVTFAERFRKLEREAREAGAGLWAGGSEENADDSAGTEDVREGGLDETASTRGRQSASCAEPLIKGNINSKGEKIYHLPGSSHYDRTKPEKWFCTEEEAAAAGFRAPKK
ncbi:thermonuclease family protein [Paenibacillus tarimensis]|uniref:thermonuclease family protein n=1 Tax=Paenibacillus tarimensis TaxID=416012 RepID=UPI001F38812F|nr:thermonuclease family protein [Paenibacillus tarimensis]MCF2942204.1 thermonuclease family protein [Paenibacillus tarimensis]